jgi:hypothetical protein
VTGAEQSEVLRPFDEVAMVDPDGNWSSAAG